MCVFSAYAENIAYFLSSSEGARHVASASHDASSIVAGRGVPVLVGILGCGEAEDWLGSICFGLEYHSLFAASLNRTLVGREGA